MESITLLLAFETAGESRQSAKHTLKSPNQQINPIPTTFRYHTPIALNQTIDSRLP
jgi:hypothetical protein